LGSNLAVLTSYVGLFGQALGVQRQFGGIMSKPWRMVALHGGAWLTFFSPATIIPRLSPFFDWTCLVIIAVAFENNRCSLETHHRRAAR